MVKEKKNIYYAYDEEFGDYFGRSRDLETLIKRLQKGKGSPTRYEIVQNGRVVKEVLGHKKKKRKGRYIPHLGYY